MNNPCRGNSFVLLVVSIAVLLTFAACNGQDEKASEPSFDKSGEEDIFSTGTGMRVGRDTDSEKDKERQVPDKASKTNDLIHIVVSLDTPPEPADLQSFRRNGLNLLEPLERKLWFASVMSNDLKEVRNLEGVQRLSPITPERKLSRDLTEDPAPYQYQRRADGRIAYSVLFHKDVSADQVRSFTNGRDVQLEEFDPTVFGIIRSVTLNIPPEGLRALTESDIVARVEPSPPPFIDHNQATAQPLSNVDKVQSAPFNLDGSGIQVGIWESGAVVLAMHQELFPRVNFATGQTTSGSNHTTHVAGIIGSSGANSPATEGMAPNVNITSWDSVNGVWEMANATIAKRIQISNHSYGWGVGWNPSTGTFINNQNDFGSYTSRSVDWDNVVYSTGLTVVKSAGNHRIDVPITGVNGGPADCLQGGFGLQADCIGTVGTAKNVITVGAMNGANNIAAFSSYGPTDDGRIKPDLVAHGSNMTSLFATSTAATGIMSGTSMSAPVVSGISALILQEANNRNMTMAPAAMKALLIQTAIDVQGVGQATPGPDYATGWGIANALGAVELLRAGGLIQGSLKITRVDPWHSATKPSAEGSMFTYQFNVPRGQRETHVTLAWADPPGVPGGLTLINDLDLRLTDPNGKEHTPWILGGASNPGQAAVRNGGNDAINNVEQVSVLLPTPGTWTVTVSAAAGNLPMGPQAFAVAGPR
jgi:hypothetical protein